MNKGPDLSSDIDFIKEFEELRLKQKILIESLNRSKKSKEKELILEINSKLDFLVKLFKDSEGEEFDEKAYLDVKFKEMNDQFIQLEKTVKDLDEKVTKIDVAAIAMEQHEEEIPEEPPRPEPKKSTDASPDIAIDTAGLNQKKSIEKKVEQSKPQPQQKVPESSKESTKSEELPPPPDFKVDESKVDQLVEDDKKGGSWFAKKKK